MKNEKRHKRILYVEASDLVHESHGAGLEKLNCAVVPVASSEAAFHELSFGGWFDLIVLGDISKPIDNDFLQIQMSVIRKARSVDPDVPILIFSSVNYINEAHEAGATAQMLKPAGVIDFIGFVTPYLV